MITFPPNEHGRTLRQILVGSQCLSTLASSRIVDGIFLAKLFHKYHAKFLFLLFQELPQLYDGGIEGSLQVIF